MLMKKLLYLVVWFILIQACNFKPDEIKLPRWQSEWLGPLSKISLSPQDIKSIDSIQFEWGVTVNHLNIAPGSYPSLPAFNGVNLSETIKTSDIYYEITFDSAIIKLFIINQMPFTIKSGTNILVKKNNSVLFSFTVNNDILPNTTFSSPEFDFAGKKLYNEVEIYLDNLSTQAINNPVTITGNEKLTIQFEIKNFQLRELAVESNNRFEVIDTTDFSFAGNEMTAEAVNGKLKVFVENQFPIQQRIQAYFMDSLFRIVDSLFAQPFVIAPSNVDGQGYSIDKPLSQSEISINPQKFENLKNAKYLLAKATFENINQSVPVTRMRRYDAFDLQVVGDLQLKYDFTKNK